METLVLKNARLIDGTGTDPIPNSFLIVEGNRIKEVSTGTPGKFPSDVTIIDCRHQTLLPGLIDAHIHAGWADEGNIMEMQRHRFPSMIVIGALKILKETLDQGFTTARDGGGADPGLREAICQGLIPGPRLFVAGNVLSQTGGHGDLRWPSEVSPPAEYVVGGFTSRICDGVDAVRRVAREQLRQGVDHIKVMAGGGVLAPCDPPQRSQYSLEELKAAVFEAESAGTYVMAHVYSNRSIRLCVEAGVRSLEHCNLLDEKTAQAIKDANAYMVPTLTTFEMSCRMWKELGIPEYFVNRLNELREPSIQALSIAHRVGVKIGSGSDAVGLVQSYKGIELELKSQVLGPMGAIVSATKTNAELLGQESDLGTIEPSKLADLILIDGDPIKDIKVFQQYRDKITLIIQGGRIYKSLL